MPLRWRKRFQSADAEIRALWRFEKSESIHKAADGTTTKLMLTESDEKSCSAGIIIQQDKQKHGETKATLTLDFKAVRNWRRSASSFILEDGIKSSPVLKSNKMEW